VSVENDVTTNTHFVFVRMPSMTRKNDFIVWLYLTPDQQRIYQDFLSLESVKEVRFSGECQRGQGGRNTRRIQFLYCLRVGKKVVLAGASRLQLSVCVDYLIYSSEASLTIGRLYFKVILEEFSIVLTVIWYNFLS
jgi:hypothetical protein